MIKFRCTDGQVIYTTKDKIIAIIVPSILEPNKVITVFMAILSAVIDKPTLDQLLKDLEVTSLIH